LWMVTGDSASNAAAIAQSIGMYPRIYKAKSTVARLASRELAVRALARELCSLVAHEDRRRRTVLLSCEQQSLLVECQDILDEKQMAELRHVSFFFLRALCHLSLLCCSCESPLKGPALGEGWHGDS
jgi:magnesium-transporting ATPase (P-type)